MASGIELEFHNGCSSSVATPPAANSTASRPSPYKGYSQCHSPQSSSTPVVATPATATVSPCNGYGQCHGTSPPYSPSLVERMHRSECFKCHEMGHWAQDCPSKTPNKSRPPSSSSKGATSVSINAYDLPVIRCFCGAYVCARTVGKSGPNHGRKFYSCNICNSFEWGDGVQAPMCPCGAGACTINYVRDEHKRKRMYFSCRIREGHGSCGYRSDHPQQSQNFESVPTSSEKGRSVQIENPQLDTILDMSSSSYSETENDMVPEYECPVLNSSNKELVVWEAGQSNPTMEKGPSLSYRMSASEIRSRQLEYWRQISDAGNSSNEDEVLQLLGSQAVGWLGRLAFPPPTRILPDASLHHFFSFIFPLFDPFNIIRDTSLDRSSSILSSTYSNAELNTAVRIRIDPIDDVDLSDDAQPMGGVVSVSPSLKRPLTSMENQCSLEDLIHAYFSEKSQFDAVSRIHEEAVAALTNSEKHLQSVREGASCIKKMLFKIENELHQCEAETLKLWNNAQDLSKSMLESKRSMQAASEKLTEALKLRQQRGEVEQSPARAALGEGCSNPSEGSMRHLKKRQRLRGSSSV